MKGKSVIVLAVLFLCACPANAIIHFRDGQTHDIDYNINDDVYVDYGASSRYTTVNMIDGATICCGHSLHGYKNSRINILDGSGIEGDMYVYDFSQVNISHGYIITFSPDELFEEGRLFSYDSSQVNISDGGVHLLKSGDSSRVNISGDSGVFFLWIKDYSQVNI